VDERNKSVNGRAVRTKRLFGPLQKHSRMTKALGIETVLDVMLRYPKPRQPDLFQESQVPTWIGVTTKLSKQVGGILVFVQPLSDSAIDLLQRIGRHDLPGMLCTDNMKGDTRIKQNREPKIKLLRQTFGNDLQRLPPATILHDEPDQLRTINPERGQLVRDSHPVRRNPRLSD